MFWKSRFVTSRRQSMRWARRWPVGECHRAWRSQAYTWRWRRVKVSIASSGGARYRRHRPRFGNSVQRYWCRRWRRNAVTTTTDRRRDGAPPRRDGMAVPYELQPRIARDHDVAIGRLKAKPKAG